MQKDIPGTGRPLHIPGGIETRPTNQVDTAYSGRHQVPPDFGSRSSPLNFNVPSPYYQPMIPESHSKSTHPSSVTGENFSLCCDFPTEENHHFPAEENHHFSTEENNHHFPAEENHHFPGAENHHFPGAENHHFSGAENHHFSSAENHHFPCNMDPYHSIVEEKPNEVFHDSLLRNTTTSAVAEIGEKISSAQPDPKLEKTPSKIDYFPSAVHSIVVSETGKKYPKKYSFYSNNISSFLNQEPLEKDNRGRDDSKLFNNAIGDKMADSKPASAENRESCVTIKSQVVNSNTQTISERADLFPEGKYETIEKLTRIP